MQQLRTQSIKDSYNFLGIPAKITLGILLGKFPGIPPGEHSGMSSREKSLRDAVEIFSKNIWRNS